MTTSPEAIQLVSLIGLRALAEFDLAEFSRVTDMSKRQLDEFIEGGLAFLREHDLPGTTEVESKLRDLHEIGHESQTHTELFFLLRQLSQSCLQRAQQLALTYSRTAAPKQRWTSSGVESVASDAFEGRGAIEEEYLRLAVMRLVRELPGYVPTFGYRLKNGEVDCMLLSRVGDTPAVIIEGKRTIHSWNHLDQTARQLKQVASGWGKRAVLAIITTAGPWRADGEPMHDPRVHVLVYDSEQDDFVGQAARHLAELLRPGAEES